jgi:hypothetical protein
LKFFFPTERKKEKQKTRNPAPVAHTCNPSYSGDREEVLDSKPAWALVHETLS